MKIGVKLARFDLNATRHSSKIYATVSTTRFQLFICYKQMQLEAKHAHI